MLPFIIYILVALISFGLWPWERIPYEGDRFAAGIAILMWPVYYPLGLIIFGIWHCVKFIISRFAPIRKKLYERRK